MNRTEDFLLTISLHCLTAKPNRLTCVYLREVQLFLYHTSRTLLNKKGIRGIGVGDVLFVLFLAVPGSVPTSDTFFPHCRLRVHLYCRGGGSVTLHIVHCLCEKRPQPLQHVLRFCPLVAFPSRTLQGVMHGICSCTLTNAFPRVEATTTFLYPP